LRDATKSAASTPCGIKYDRPNIEPMATNSKHLFPILF
jgi:hypothetical protein